MRGIERGDSLISMALMSSPRPRSVATGPGRTWGPPPPPRAVAPGCARARTRAPWRSRRDPTPVWKPSSRTLEMTGGDRFETFDALVPLERPDVIVSVTCKSLAQLAIAHHAQDVGGQRGRVARGRHQRGFSVEGEVLHLAVERAHDGDAAGHGFGD